MTPSADAWATLLPSISTSQLPLPALQPPPGAAPTASLSKLSLKRVDAPGVGVGVGAGVRAGVGVGRGVGLGVGVGVGTGVGAGINGANAGGCKGSGVGRSVAAGVGTGAALGATTAAAGAGLGSAYGSQLKPEPAKGSQLGAWPVIQTNVPGPLPNMKMASRRDSARAKTPEATRFRCLTAGRRPAASRIESVLISLRSHQREQDAIPAAAAPERARFQSCHPLGALGGCPHTAWVIWACKPGATRPRPARRSGRESADNPAR